MMKYSAALLVCLPFVLGLGACDKAVDPVPKTDTTTTTPTATAWTATVSLNSLQLTTAQLNATSSIQATATQGTSAVSTKSVSTVSDIINLAIPSGQACIVTVNGYDASRNVIWTGSTAIAKSLPAAVITLNSVGGTVVTPGDDTPLSYRSTQEAGAQTANPGSFISVRGDAIDPNGFVLTSGDKTTEEEGAIDLVFFAMTNGVKDPTSGTPSFVSPNSLKSSLNWATLNKTIIVKAAGSEASYATVQSVKDAIGSSTSESAPVVSGGVYALQLSNGKYAILSVTSLAGKSGAAVVTFRILNSGAASTSGGSTGGGTGGGTTNPTGDQTLIKDQGGTFVAGAQQATAGSNISVRGDALSPEGFVLTSGEKTAAEEAAMDLLFTAMIGNTRDAAGTPSFVSPSLLKSSLGWATTNQTLIVSLPLASISDFSTVQDIKDAFVANQSSVSYSAAVVQGGIYALWLSNDDYAVLQVTSLTGANGKASVSFKIYK